MSAIAGMIIGLVLAVIVVGGGFFLKDHFAPEYGGRTHMKRLRQQKADMLGISPSEVPDDTLLPEGIAKVMAQQDIDRLLTTKDTESIEDFRPRNRSELLPDNTLHSDIIYKFDQKQLNYMSIYYQHHCEVLYRRYRRINKVQGNIVDTRQQYSKRMRWQKEADSEVFSDRDEYSDDFDALEDSSNDSTAPQGKRRITAHRTIRSLLSRR